MKPFYIASRTMNSPTKDFDRNYLFKSEVVVRSSIRHGTASNPSSRADLIVIARCCDPGVHPD